MKDFTIRKLTSKDSKELETLISIIESNLERKEFWLPINDIARSHFFYDDWTEFYGVFDEDILVGAAALFYNEHEFGESLKELGEDLYPLAEMGRAMINPEYRGNNLIQLINNKLIDVAKSKNIKYILATIHPENIPSKKSFMKIGGEYKTTYKKSNGYVRDIFILTL